jgi:aryl-alcohol dehydrogenase-like predicted oxidoreductase
MSQLDGGQFSVIFVLMLLKLITHATSFEMRMSIGNDHRAVIPFHSGSELKINIAKITAASVMPLVVALVLSPEKASSMTISDVKKSTSSFGADAYTTLSGLPLCRIMTGMWQVSGAHGYDPQKDKAVSEMSHCAEEGFSTFDLADIYGPAEEYVGAFKNGRKSSNIAKSCQFFTKWVPQPGEISLAMATAAIDRSLRRMSTDSLDLLQFNWFPYQNKNYFEAMNHLIALKASGKIKNIGLTNFDTEHMAGLVAVGAPIVSNQIAYSVIDTRPQKKMAEYCQVKGIQLLCYGTLMGGFLSSDWLGKPEPLIDSLTNVSLRKYLPWIKYWGGWGLFQEMLIVLDVIAKKHSVSLSNVAVRWVLDQQAVGGAIVGVRLGLKEHLADNKKVFSFSLDGDDLKAIIAVQDKSKDLMTVFGDCGGEYRFRIRS